MQTEVQQPILTQPAIPLRTRLNRWLLRLWPVTSANSRTAPLDGLRGVAVLMVVVYHIIISMHELVDTKANPGVMGALQPAWDFGRSGVELFFVLSGFLLFIPYARAMFANTALPTTGKFYLRRALRILPAYWAALFIIVLFLNPDHAPNYGGDITMHFFLVHDLSDDTVYTINGVFWTMAVESHYYILLPLLAGAIWWLWRYTTTPRPSGGERHPTFPRPSGGEQYPTFPLPSGGEQYPTSPLPTAAEQYPTSPLPAAAERHPNSPLPSGEEQYPTSPLPSGGEGQGEGAHPLRPYAVGGLLLMVGLSVAYGLLAPLYKEYNPVIQVFLGFQSVFKYLVVFAVGMACSLLYIAVTEGPLVGRQEQIRAFCKWAGLGGLALFALDIAASFGAKAQLLGFNQLFRELTLGLIYGCILLGALLGWRSWGRLMASPPLRFVGIISYSLYIWNGIIFWGLVTPLAANVHPTWLALLASAALAIVIIFPIAFVSYYLFERPFIGLRLREH